jgi:hypothetical protein
MGVEGREAVRERGAPQPRVMPEGSGFAALDTDNSDRAEGGEARTDVFPDRGGARARVSQVPIGSPPIPSAEPTSPGGSGIGVEFGKELGKKSFILSLDG